MSIHSSFQVGPVVEPILCDLMVTLRFIVPRTIVHEGMTSDVDDAVLGEMAAALAKARKQMKEGTL